MRFYLGTHMPNWLSQTTIPLFVSDVRLRGRKTLPTAVGKWALDSGAFSQLLTYGAWQPDDMKRYADRVMRYQVAIGGLEWAAPQDWMCEPFMLTRTGKTVEEHQHLTIENFVTLRALAPTVSFIPVLQGYTLSDYVRHSHMYAQAGIDLGAESRIGVGSVCRRQATQDIASIMMRLSSDFPGVLHGFGVKISGLRLYASMLGSADSMAWSFDARRKEALSGHTHKNCANCLQFAQQWYQRVATY